MGKSEYEIGYLDGFYSALRGTHYITTLEDSTVQEIREGCEDVFKDMIREDEMKYIRGGIDEFMDAAHAAHESGRDEEFYTALDHMIEQHDKNKGNH